MFARHLGEHQVGEHKVRPYEKYILEAIMMEAQDRLIFALDVPHKQQALDLEMYFS